LLYVVVVILILIIIVVVSMIICSKRRYMGGNDSAVWDINSGSCYDKRIIKECIEFTKSIKGYGPVDDDQRIIIKSFVDSINKKHNTNLSTSNIISIRNNEILNKISELNVDNLPSETIISKFSDHESILDISQSLEIPPMLIVKCILRDMKFNKRSISDIIKNIYESKYIYDTYTIDKYLSDQIKDAKLNDITSDINSLKTKDIAQKYEDRLYNFLRKENINFWTEDELRQNQTVEFGRPYLTPDVLLKEPIKINGDSIYWIDAKDYLLYNNKFMIKKVKAQALKYYNQYGLGALIFSGGFECGIDKLLEIDRRRIVVLLNGKNI